VRKQMQNVPLEYGMSKMHLFTYNFAFIPSTYHDVGETWDLFSHGSQTCATKFSHFERLSILVVENVAST